MDTPIALIVGLGNPGSDYRNTRHNAGADFVTELAAHSGVNLLPENKFYGNTARIQTHNLDLRLLNPTTFMNCSGQAVAAIAQFYKIPPEAILVAHDELDLAPGVARLKIGGGHGGHNGLRDIISAQGNNKMFARLRLGIGHPGSAAKVTGHVLKKASLPEQALIQSAIDHAVKCIPDIASGNFGKAMQTLHSAC